MNGCDWCKSDDLYIKYHDDEWGVPVHDDRKHFDFLVLEASQSGLSWLTILRKRENYRKAFDNFEPEKVAKYGEEKIEELLSDPGIIRNRRKIEVAVVNAAKFLEVQKEFGSFDNYIWGFVNNTQVMNSHQNISQVPATIIGNVVPVILRVPSLDVNIFSPYASMAMTQIFISK